MVVAVPPNGTRHSPNLARWLNKNQRAGLHIQVYGDKDGVKWIGWIDDDTWFIGTRLARVLTKGVRAEVGAWTFPVTDLSIIPSFWAEYERIGRCAIDTAHRTVFIGDESRWTQVGDHRRCNWCGEHEQTLHRWTRTIECQEWRADVAVSDAA